MFCSNKISFSLLICKKKFESSTKRRFSTDKKFVTSLIKMVKNTEPNTDPLGAPVVGVKEWKEKFLYFITLFLSVRWDCNVRSKLYGMSGSASFWYRIEWSTLSKASYNFSFLKNLTCYCTYFLWMGWILFCCQK